MKCNKDFRQTSQSGAVTMEYVFMLMLIAVCCVMGVANFGTVVSDTMGDCSLKNPLTSGFNGNSGC